MPCDDQPAKYALIDARSNDWMDEGIDLEEIREAFEAADYPAILVQVLETKDLYPPKAP